jgi:hypothetical protein
MKPLQVSSILRRIAAKIDASKQPDPKLVNRDLKRVIAGMNNSMQEDLLNYSFTFKEKSKSDNKIIVEVKGTDPKGKPFAGNFIAYIENGRFDGWNWEPLMGNMTFIRPDALMPLETGDNGGPDPAEPIINAVCEKYDIPIEW